MFNKENKFLKSYKLAIFSVIATFCLLFSAALYAGSSTTNSLNTIKNNDVETMSKLLDDPAASKFITSTYSSDNFYNPSSNPNTIPPFPSSEMADLFLRKGILNPEELIDFVLKTFPRKHDPAIGFVTNDFHETELFGPGKTAKELKKLKMALIRIALHYGAEIEPNESKKNWLANTLLHMTFNHTSLNGSGIDIADEYDLIETALNYGARFDEIDIDLKPYLPPYHLAEKALYNGLDPSILIKLAFLANCKEYNENTDTHEINHGNVVSRNQLINLALQYSTESLPMLYESLELIQELFEDPSIKADTPNYSYIVTLFKKYKNIGIQIQESQETV